MYSSIIIFLLIMLFLKLFFRVDRSMTFCGIFAFSGINEITIEQARNALLKIKILGLYNESRGRDGSGMFINDNIIKCGDKHKTFPALIENNFFEPSETNHIVLGHCRRMSRGSVSTENTHPFEINDDLVGIHNGTIENIWTLMRERKLDSTKIYNDSKGLYTIIEEEGVEVLNEYKGFAAMMWTRKSLPNTMYAYHGSSKNSAAGKPVEERPLFYMATAEGIYFSSLIEALWAIRDNEEQVPETLPCNTVFEITSGKFTSNEYEVEREEANVPVNFYYNNNNNYNNPTNNNTTNWPNTRIPLGNQQSNSQNARIGASSSTLPFKADIKEQPTIWIEKLPLQVTDIKNIVGIYFHKGRYYKAPGTLCQGKMPLLKKGIFAVDGSSMGTTNYYFFDGIMLRDETSFKRLMADISNGVIPMDNHEANFAMHLSKYSKYPITNLPCESTKLAPEHRYRWYINERPALETFTPKFSSRNYDLSNGYLKAVTSSQPKDNSIFFGSFDEAARFTDTLKEGVLVGHDTNFHKEDAPFTKTDSCCGPKDPVLDTVHTNYQKLIRNIPQDYMIALRYFAKECLEKENTLDPDNEEVDAEVMRYLTVACHDGVTIRTACKDTQYVLEEFISLTRRAAELIGRRIEDDSTAMMDARDFGLGMMSTEDIDDALRESTEQEEEEHERSTCELEKANDIIEDAVDIISSLSERCAELSENESTFGKECTTVITRSLENLKYGLGQAALEHSTSDITTKINNKIGI